jgi:hypothetical protein
MVGCVQTGRHTTTCDLLAACPGCLPRPAAAGHAVCATCGTRARTAIAAAPAIVDHLHTLKRPPARWHDDTRTPSGAPGAPLNVNAVVDADTLHALLAAWAVRIADARDLTGPSWAGSDIRPGARVRLPDGRTAYTQPRVVGVRHPDATRTVSGWLTIHLDWQLGQPSAAALVQEVPPLVATLTARWPTQQRQTVRLPVPCPACGTRSLTKHAPQWAGQPQQIVCDLAGCGHTVPEDRYAWLTRLIDKDGAA